MRMLSGGPRPHRPASSENLPGIVWFGNLPTLPLESATTASPGVISEGELMKARELIARAAYEPDQLRVLCEAFDQALEIIAVDVDDRPEAIEANRLKLANVILSLAGNGGNDAVWLRDAALNIMRATLGKD